MSTWSCRSLALVGGVALLSAQAAAQDRAVPLAIAKKPVGKALQELAAKTGANILFTPGAVAGMRSAPVRATVTAEQGARKMLAGTGLQVIRDQNGALLIQPQETRPSRVGLVQPAPRRDEPVRYVALQLAARAADSARPVDSGPPSEPRAGESDAPGDIVVTARRRTEDVFHVPLSISAFSGPTLERRGVSNLQDIVKITPGVNITPAASRNQPFITIRGSSKGVTGNISPGVISYFNDVPLSNNGANLPTFDVQSIQVLKGPQGTLFGRNSVGGAILVNSNAPTHKLEGYATVDVASYDYRRFEGALNLPLGNAVALRLAAQIYHDGGATNTLRVSPPVVDSITGIITSGTIIPSNHRVDENKGVSFRASLLIEPRDSLKNILVFDYSLIRGGLATQLDALYPATSPAVYFLPASTILSRLGPVTGQNVINLAQCGILACDWRLVQNYFASNTGRQAILNSDPWRQRNIVWGITNTTTVRLSDFATLKNIFGYRSTNTFINSDLDATPLIISLSGGQVRLKQYTDELQLSGSILHDRLKYTIGGFYSDETPDGPGGNSGLESIGTMLTSHSIQYTYLHSRSRAIYGQLDYALDGLVRGLVATAGARQTWDSVAGCAGSVVLTSKSPALLNEFPNSHNFPTEDQCRTNAVPLAQYPFARSTLSQNFPKASFSKLTYTLGLNWQISPNVMVYGVHRRGYRTGGYNTPLFDKAFLSQVQAFKPETLEDWEIGTKARWRAGSLRGTLELALFTGKDKGYQLPVTTGNLGAGVCVPQAISASRPANCTTLGGLAGVSIAHPASTTVVNGGDLTIRGVEAAATLSPVEGLTLAGGVAYVDYKVDKVSLDPNLLALLRAGNIVPPTTIVLQQQPSWTYNFSLDARLPVTFLGSDVGFSAIYKHSDRYWAPNAIVPGYYTVDARIALENIGRSGIDLFFYVKNLTDNFYAVYKAGNASSLGFLVSDLAPPRTFGISAKYRFGT